MRKIKFSLLLTLLGCSMLGFGVEAKLRQVAMIDLPGSPGFSQVTMANGQVVITRPGTNTIEIFSPVKRRVVARISQISDPRGIAVDDESGMMYVALAGNNGIAVIDTRNWRVEKVVPVQHRPEKLLWVPQTKTLYATSTLDRCLSMIDLRINAEANVLQLDALPQDMLYDNARHVLLLSLQDLRQIAVIGENEFVISSALEPDVPIGLGVAGFAIVGNFIRGENVVLVFDPDVADQRIDLALLLLLPGFEAHGDTRGRRGNQFSNRIIGRVRKRRWAWIRGKLLGQRLRPKLEMTQH